MTIYLIEFLGFGFFGWLVDSSYSSLLNSKWISSGYFKAPICPIYGFGGLLLMLVFKNVNALPAPALFLVAGLMMVILEYFGGVFSQKVLKVRLWDYSESRLDINGHIDLIYAIYWFLLSIFFYYILFPAVVYFENNVKIPEAIDLAIFGASVVLFIIFAKSNKAIRQKVVKKRL